MKNINELDQRRIDKALDDFFEKQKVNKIKNPQLLPYESTNYELALLEIFDIVMNSKDNSKTLDEIIDVLLENIEFSKPIFAETIRQMGNGLFTDEDGINHFSSRNYLRKKSL